MKKSGLADSPFFAAPPEKNEALTPLSTNPPAPKARVEKTKKSKEHKIEQPSHRDTTTPRYHDTTQSIIDGAIVELVRKAVRELGKEAATHRFTQAEKKEIGDIIYTYKNQGLKTSENEVTRIAVNFIIEDYKENGKNSVLHKILEALNE